MNRKRVGIASQAAPPSSPQEACESMRISADLWLRLAARSRITSNGGNRCSPYACVNARSVRSWKIQNGFADGWVQCVLKKAGLRRSSADYERWSPVRCRPSADDCGLAEKDRFRAHLPRFGNQ